MSVKLLDAQSLQKTSNHDGGHVSKGKHINENLLGNNNSSYLEKGKSFKAITTVVNKLKGRKKTTYKEHAHNYLCKERSILLSEVKLFLITTLLHLLRMEKS